MATKTSLIREYNEAVLLVIGRSGSPEHDQEIATEWHGYFGGKVRLAEEYMRAGCWDAYAASQFRDAGIEPYELKDLGPILGNDDPVNAVCNGDMHSLKVAEHIRAERD